MAFDYSSSGAILRSFASDRSKSRVRSADGLAFLETVRKAKGDQLDGGVLGSLRDLIADSGDEKMEWEILALGFQYLSEEFRDLLPEFYSGPDSWTGAVRSWFHLIPLLMSLQN